MLLVTSIGATLPALSTLEVACPITARDAVDGARAALRAARKSGHKRLQITLPVLMPGATLDDAIGPDGSALYPGGGAQSHRLGLQPIAQELFKGYDPIFHGKIDVGMGVWSLAGGEITAVSSVADMTFETFAKLCEGEFGEAPTRSDHTLLLLNPRLTSAANIGQPWQFGLRKRAVELVDETDWLCAFCCRPVGASDGSTCLGVTVSSELDAEGQRGSHRSFVSIRGQCIARRDAPSDEPFTSRTGLASARQLIRDRLQSM